MYGNIFDYWQVLNFRFENAPNFNEVREGSLLHGERDEVVNETGPLGVDEIDVLCQIKR